MHVYFKRLKKTDSEASQEREEIFRNSIHMQIESTDLIADDDELRSAADATFLELDQLEL